VIVIVIIVIVIVVAIVIDLFEKERMKISSVVIQAARSLAPLDAVIGRCKPFIILL
jgi:hypothetical protein